VLPVKIESPEYIAVIVWEPAESADVLPEVALPLVRVTGEPKFTPSILNCTVPVAVDGDTVAVNEMG
jgi:hypothetical protein